MSKNKFRRAVAPAGTPVPMRTNDSIQNAVARLGWGQNNQTSQSFYQTSFLSRFQQQLDQMYRTSWICGQAVNVIADDMVRAGIDIEGDFAPGATADIQSAMERMGVWQKLNSNLKWGRLYGGSIAVILIEGQKLNTPLRIETVGKDAFKGLAVLDRWLVQPDLNNPIMDLGPKLGKPSAYKVVAQVPGLANQVIHHTRIIRAGGLELPFIQSQAENGWDQSVIERIFDQVVAYDSTSQGTGQLVFKAHLRTMKVKGLRQIIATGGKVLEAFLMQMDMVRAGQSNEGMTLVDGEDEYEAHNYSFAGLDNVLLQFGQQLSGALQMPLTKLFGQSPAGMNATGDSDLENYESGIHQRQEADLREGLFTIVQVTAKSLGIAVPPNAGMTFRPLRIPSEKDKAEIAQKITDSVVKAYDSSVISQKTALIELRSWSKASGMWGSITDEDVAAASDEVPDPNEALGDETEGSDPPGGKESKDAL